MSQLRLIADVHISPLTVAALKVEGYDVVRTTDLFEISLSPRIQLSCGCIVG